jgi:iron complex transport system ATP-binding protein
MNDGLTVKGLSAGYGKVEVISDIDLPTMQHGRVVGLLGQNAAGKSTLLKSLAGQIKYKGHAQYDEHVLSDLSIPERVARIGYLPQTPIQSTGLLVWEVALSMFRATSAELSNKEAEDRIQTVFKTLDLEKYAFKPVDELSGGKRQLLGLALIIARQTRLMLLDEPTSALDLRWQLETLSVVKKVVEEINAISIIALHDINLALRFCDDVIMLCDGKVLAAGPSKEVINSDLLRRAYNVEARVEQCSKGHSIVLVDKPLDR